MIPASICAGVGTVRSGKRCGAISRAAVGVKADSAEAIVIVCDVLLWEVGKCCVITDWMRML